METMMEALVWTGPREMEMRQVPVPVPGPGEVLVAVAAAGICGSEISGFLGLNKLRVPPLVMGHEASGRIAAADGGRFADGSPARTGVRVTFNPLITCGECDRCRAGHENLCRKRALIGVHRPGGYAKFVAVPAGQCWPMPDSMSDTAGALAEPLACAVRAVALSGVGKGGRLLVVGAGIIGLGCLLAARQKKVKEVIVADRDARGAVLVVPGPEPRGERAWPLLALRRAGEGPGRPPAGTGSGRAARSGRPREPREPARARGPVR